MAKFAVILGLGVLVSTVAVADEVMEQTDDVTEQQSAGTATAGLSAGFGALALPTFTAPPVMGTGSGSLISDTFDILGIGGTIGAGGSFSTGPVGPFGGSISLGGFWTYAQGSASVLNTLSGDGVLYIPGITTPAGTITLLTDAGVPSASSTIAGTTSDQVVTVPVNAAGAQNAWGTVQGTPGEFTLSGGATYAGAPANYAVAFGAIANATGGAFLAAGDLTGVVVETSTNVEIMYAGGDVTYGLSGTLGTGAVIQVYGGASLLYLDQNFTTEISVDMAEIDPVAPADFEFPLYTQITNEQLVATYIGGVVGSSISMQLSDSWAMSLNGEAGLYWATADLTATESYTLSGGGNLPVNQTVTNGTTFTDSNSQMAYAGRVQAVLSNSISQNQQIHFGGGAEYLSAVPTISRAAADYPIAAGAGDATYTGASTGGTPSITWGDMINWNMSISLTGQF